MGRTNMKKSVSLLIGLFLLISTPVVFGEETYKMSDLVIRDGLYYKKFTDVPFTGKITGKSQGTIRNGKRDGDWFKYHDNGQLSRKGSYKNGKRDGLVVAYWDNGQLRFEGTFKDGEDDGYHVQYYENGNLWWEQNYKNGEWDGVWRKYYENGQVMWETIYDKGRLNGLYISYHEDGEVNVKIIYSEEIPEGKLIYPVEDDLELIYKDGKWVKPNN